MKKHVLTFGLISGAISSVMMLLTLPFMNFEWGEVVGYTLIVASFLPIFFGVRSYRENVGRGRLTFGAGFTIGLLITVISSMFYVATWEVIYFKLAPDFAVKYQAYAIEHARAAGATPQQLEETRHQMEHLKTLLDQPLTNAAMTFLEPLPVGLLVSLVSAAVLRRKEAAGVVEAG